MKILIEPAAMIGLAIYGVWSWWKRRKDDVHGGMKPHTHHGYLHNENDSAKGAAKLTTEEKKMVERVERL